MINGDEIILQWPKSILVGQILFLITDFSALNLNLNSIVIQPNIMGFNTKSEFWELMELLIL